MIPIFANALGKSVFAINPFWEGSYGLIKSASDNEDVSVKDFIFIKILSLILSYVSLSSLDTC